MAELAVVRRYARALFDTARRGTQPGSGIEQVEADLKLIHQVVHATPSLFKAFKSPHLSQEMRKGLLARTLGKHACPLTQRFLVLLVDRRREDVLANIYVEFLTLANQARNVLPVEVRSAVPLTEPELEALAASLYRRTGKQPVLELRLDPELLGGIVIRMGDTVIDGSVAGKLRQVRAKLNASQG